jgi:hypothetical protein
VTPGTQTLHDSVNEGNKELWYHEQGVGMGWISMKFLWQNISMLSEVEETFCGIHSPQSKETLRISGVWQSFIDVKHINFWEQYHYNNFILNIMHPKGTVLITTKKMVSFIPRQSNHKNDVIWI